MSPLGKLTTAFAVAAFAFTSSLCGAQRGSESSIAQSTPTPIPADSSGMPYKTKPVPSLETITAFSDSAAISANTKLIEFRPEDGISEPDRDLATSAERSIREDATLAGFELDKGNWSHEQLVCQALPDYLILLYKGDNGGNDVSLFTAAISRSNKGHVRVIPIQRRGYSLYSPTPVNGLAISLFNHVRSGDPASKSADWLSTALCYAAMTGAHPETTSPDHAKNADLSLTFPPTIEIQAYGQSTVRFVDIASTSQPMEWALTFDSKGQLLKVVRFALPAYAVKPIPELPAQ
jgi:hypothetical protein